MSAPRAPLRPLDDALAELLGHAKPLDGTETVSTFDATGRVLAQDLVSALQVPPQDNSSMDGYAVRSNEIADEGVPLPVSQRIPAGSAAQPLAPGSVARIFTGAPIPPGADAVVMQEDTEPAGEQAIRILRVPEPGQWIRRSGEDVHPRRGRPGPGRAAVRGGARAGREHWPGQVAGGAAAPRGAFFHRRRAGHAGRGGTGADEARRHLQLQPLLPVCAAAPA